MKNISKIEKIEALLVLTFAMSVIFLKMAGHKGLATMSWAMLITGLPVVWATAFAERLKNTQPDMLLLVAGVVSKLFAAVQGPGPIYFRFTTPWEPCTPRCSAARTARTQSSGAYLLKIKAISGTRRGNW